MKGAGPRQPPIDPIELLESMSDGFYALSPHWRFTYANPLVERLSGRPREQLLGMDVWELFPHAVGSDLWQAHQDVMRLREPAQVHTRSMAVGRWVEAKVRPTADGGVCVLFRDVEEEVQVRARLDTSEARLRAIADAMPVLISYIDADQRFQFANSAYEQRFQRPLDQIVGRTAREVFGDELYEARRPYVERALAGERVTYEVPFPRGEETLITVVDHIPHRAPDGRILGIYALIQDVTGLRQAQAALETNQRALRELNENLEAQVLERTAALAESERRFRAIFDSALQFMALLTPDGVVVEINRTAFRWSRIDPAEVVGRPLWLAPPVSERPELRAAVEAGVRRAAAGQVVRDEHVLRGGDGGLATVDFSLKPVTDEAGQVLWLAAEARDITELKLAQEQLRQSQKMEAIGQLTGGIAHDFNNLLTIIRSSADLLRRHDLQEAKRRRYVDAISDTADRAAELTSQLLSFARRQALKPVVFDVGERVSEISRMIQSVVGSRIRVETALTDAVCHIEADRSQFETALINMAVNARDAMNGEGRLTIGLRRAFHVPRVRRSAGEFVAVSVTDTGQGIPPDQLERIFEPFFTTKEVGKGTGLGLSQVYGFAKQSGGEVVVESEPGRGATFTLYLPVSEKPPEDEAAPGRPAAVGTPVRRARILVVEDNPDVGEFARQLLHDFGYETVWAMHAAEALQRLETDGAFDLVFSDVVMPGMSGVELAGELRRRWPSLPVVLTTGYSDALADQGAQGIELLRKPYSVEALSKVLRRVLH